ncbi:flavin-containing monooxygenase 5-like isoform X1 [Chroicocephalus ridibundus]|uniref:flavin-containing monooxygenase 5-like isoform X1 n=1 Tax=Chroicocephalus ridibundus TaxID=1192867 RepID=UPI002FDDE3E0
MAPQAALGTCRLIRARGGSRETEAQDPPQPAVTTAWPTPTQSFLFPVWWGERLQLWEGAGGRDGCYDHPWLNPTLTSMVRQQAASQPWGPWPVPSCALLPQEHPEEGRASIYRSVIINTSKEMMCFSDFPIPDHFPNYMHNSKIMEYFRMYAQRFDLLRHIRFRTSVCHVAKCPNFAATGQWEVVTESEGKQEAAVFDAVLVCTGHHTEAHLPLSTFPGLEKFEGWYLHSRDYKSPQSFLGKRVVVVGTGNSGIDIAVELSHAAKQVFLSTKRGTWVMHRVADGGYPFDFTYINRFLQLLRSLLPHNVSSFFMERKLNARFDHALYGLQPQHRIFDQHPTINDDLPNRIISGTVLVKPNIQEFTETSAVFVDGTKEDIDAVVFATGYSFSFPFLEGCVQVVENQIPLYKFMFPPDLEKPTLAFIGLIQPLGAIMPVSELQCRWATRVFKGLQDLPPSADMLADIAQAKEEMAKRYVKSQRHTIQVDYIPYMDELACQVGVKPNLLALFLTDPKLALEVAFGPCTPYQYRLRGPGKWSGAREAILTQRQRVVRPLQTRTGARPARSSTVPHIFKVFFSIGLIAATAVYISLSP